MKFITLFYFLEGKATCEKCKLSLSSAAVLSQHMEKYCRYRLGKKAKQSVMRRGDVLIDDDCEFRNEQSVVNRKGTSKRSHARDYELTTRENVVDVQRWLLQEEPLVRRVYDALYEYHIKGRLLLKDLFIKRSL